MYSLYLSRGCFLEHEQSLRRKTYRGQRDINILGCNFHYVIVIDTEACCLQEEKQRVSYVCHCYPPQNSLVVKEVCRYGCIPCRKSHVLQPFIPCQRFHCMTCTYHLPFALPDAGARCLRLLLWAVDWLLCVLYFGLPK